jgi:2-oxoglutarate ferredoxin oxidoreductase subunit alpha
MSLRDIHPLFHQKMTELRRNKRDKIAEFIPELTIEQGKEKGDVLVLGWGSTYGSIRTAVEELMKEGMDISQAHVQYISPFPRNMAEVLSSFDKIIVPEINDGQLVRLIRDQYGVDAVGVNKVKGLPFGVEELKSKIKQVLNVEAAPAK